MSAKMSVWDRSLKEKQLTFNQLKKERYLPVPPKCCVSVVVNTSPFHGEDTGANPVHNTILICKRVPSGEGAVCKTVLGRFDPCRLLKNNLTNTK